MIMMEFWLLKATFSTVEGDSGYAGTVYVKTMLVALMWYVDGWTHQLHMQQTHNYCLTVAAIFTGMMTNNRVLSLLIVAQLCKRPPPQPKGADVGRLLAAASWRFSRNNFVG